MNKELEALKNIHNHWSCFNPNSNGCDEEDFKLIETALNEKTNIESRIDEIFENHNIKSFTELNERLCDYNELKFDDDIKQNKLKALEIATKYFEFSIELGSLPNGIPTYKLKVWYKGTLAVVIPISKEEFDLLKEVLL